LKKTPTRHHPMFKPANLSGFQNAAGIRRAIALMMSANNPG
jgi:hypothetical protein